MYCLHKNIIERKIEMQLLVDNLISHILNKYALTMALHCKGER